MSRDPQLSTDPIKVSEPVGERNRRYARRARLYLTVLAAIVAAVVLVALVVSNTRNVELDWLVGSGEASLVWVVVVSGAVGWVGGVATAVIVRRRTRGPR